MHVVHRKSLPTKILMKDPNQSNFSCDVYNLQKSRQKIKLCDVADYSPLEGQKQRKCFKILLRGNKHRYLFDRYKRTANQVPFKSFNFAFLGFVKIAILKNKQILK